MKKFILLLTVFYAFTFSACKKSEDTPSTASSFKATVDGAAWTPKEYSASYRYDVFVLAGKSSSGESIIIRMKLVPGHEADQAFYQFFYNDDKSTGLYLAKENDAAYATNQFDGSKPLPGTISFTKFDKTAKKASGSFNFKVKRVTDNGEKTITGTFENVVYDDKIPPTPAKTMTAKVDGTAWSATAVTAISSDLTKTIQIVGNASNGTTIGVTLPYKILPGTYNTANFGSTTAQFNPSPTTFMMAESGSITVTSHDQDAEIIKGTFTFVAKDDILGQKNITEGTFVAVY